MIWDANYQNNIYKEPPNYSNPRLAKPLEPHGRHKVVKSSMKAFTVLIFLFRHKNELDEVFFMLSVTYTTLLLKKFC